MASRLRTPGPGEPPSGALGESRLVNLAVSLGALQVGGPLSTGERDLVHASIDDQLPSQLDREAVRRAILNGEDPLGASLARWRPASERRRMGAVYTPPPLVKPMVDWVLAQGPVRVVDAGAGSGRFTVEVARRAPRVELVAVDSDPMATLLTRAALAALGRPRASVLHADYTNLALPPVEGLSAFLGNPPYVRHHQLGHSTKAWAQAAAARAGHRISGLAGLHAHFFLATALLGRPGDVGCFVTSSEWLDVNYGSIVRELLLNGLGGRSIHILDASVLPFDDAATTAAITCFSIGDRPRSMRLRAVGAVEDLGNLEGGRAYARPRLEAARRWSPLVRTGPKVPEGHVELGELCRVHRGAVTGLNSLWVASAANAHSLPEGVLFPTVTRARELFEAGAVLRSIAGLRRVIDLPSELDVLDEGERKLVERFLRIARAAGGALGYIARHRRAWWSVGLRAPAPILATYMARRPPAFVRNAAGARHINIAHGIYPRVELPATALDRLAAALRSSTTVAQGRTYAGGLTKFEPKEMERLPVPDLPVLMAE